MSKERRILSLILEEKEIHSVYQPIVSLESGEVFGFEALSRIDQKECEINVEELFQLAQQFEKTWELECICRKKALKGYSKQKGEKKLFLNVEPHVIHDEKFKAGMTKEYLERYQINPRDIIFEVTERAYIEDRETFRETMEHYKRQDFQLAIDDLGSGYAGVSRIYYMEPQFIKIDMSLIRDIHLDEVKSSIVEGFVYFCKSMGIKLIAEGIEKVEELEKIIQLGVDFGQGYYLGKPDAEIKDIDDKIKKRILKEKQGRLEMHSLPSFFGKIGSISQKKHVMKSDLEAIRVFECMRKNPEITEVCVVDSDNKVCGLLTRSYLEECFGGQYGYNLNHRKAIFQLVHDDYLAVDYEMSIETVAKMALLRPQKVLYDAVVVTKNGMYQGVVTVKDLLQSAITIQVERATDANPLTHLPGNQMIEERIESCLKGEEAFSVMYLDLDNFKAYNDAYGFENGDLMIKAVANCMKFACKRDEFLGHVGGDDFVIIANHYDMHKIYQEIIEQFHIYLRELYTEEDYERQEIASRNRSGLPENFPLASLSCALITNEKLYIKNIRDFSTKIAITKKQSKKMKGDSLKECEIQD